MQSRNSREPISIPRSADRSGEKRSLEGRYIIIRCRLKETIDQGDCNIENSCCEVKSTDQALARPGGCWRQHIGSLHVFAAQGSHTTRSGILLRAHHRHKSVYWIAEGGRRIRSEAWRRDKLHICGFSLSSVLWSIIKGRVQSHGRSKFLLQVLLSLLGLEVPSILMYNVL